MRKKGGGKCDATRDESCKGCKGQSATHGMIISSERDRNNKT